MSMILVVIGAEREGGIDREKMETSYWMKGERKIIIQYIYTYIIVLKTTCISLHLSFYF